MRNRVCILVVIGILVVSTGVTYADPAMPLPRVPIGGDQDGSETPLTFRASSYDLLRDVQAFRIPGEGVQTVQFDFVFREGTYNNEFGYFKVDDMTGRVGDVSPGEPAYLDTVFQQATVVFPSGSSAYTADITATLEGGEILIFFLIQNSSLDRFRSSNPQNALNKYPLAFFSLDTLNPDHYDHFVGFRNVEAQRTQFGFEDLTGGGDRDYDDIVYTISTTLQPAPTTALRDVVFIRGFTSEGGCEGANDWLRRYLDEHQGRGLYRNLRIGTYLNFNYAGGGSYACPLQNGTPAYVSSDTCDGVVKAATELKQLIDTAPSPTVSIIAHSMGGLVAAYMVAANPLWAQQRVASIISFESPLKGLLPEGVAAYSLIKLCPLGSLSARDMAENSTVVQKASSAATLVPFYPLDAEGNIPDLVFPRSMVRLDQSRPFTLMNWCGHTAFEPDCAPPTPINDDHSSLWVNPESQEYSDGGQKYRINKAGLVACGVAVALDCTTIGPASQGTQALAMPLSAQLQITVPPQTGRAQFVATYSSPVRMRLTSPSGTVYGPDGTGPIAGYSVDATSEVYQITDAQAGAWTIELLGTPAAIAQTEVAFSVLELAPPAEPLAPQADAGGPYRQRVGAPVIFSAAGSYDPDGAISYYEWDFDGNGSFDLRTQLPSVAHTYAGAFAGSASVRVVDRTGKFSNDTAEVRVSYIISLPVARR